MRIEIERHALRDALALLSSSVKKQPGAITSYILFSVSEDKVRLRASDNFVYTNVVLGAADGVREVVGQGEFTVEADRLAKWVANVTGEYVQVTYEGESEVVLRSGTYESPFMSQPADNFPSKVFEASRGEAEEKGEVRVEVLEEALTFIKDFPSDTTSNTDPTGKFRVAQMRGDELQGTNAVVLGVYKSEQLGHAFKIGVEQIGPALAYLKRQPEDTIIRTRETETFYFFEVDAESYFGFVKPRVDLPELKDVPTGQEESEIFEVEKVVLKQALNALRATADPDNTSATFTVENGIVTLSKQAVLGDRVARVEIPCTPVKTGGESFKFTANDVTLEKVMSTYGENFTIAYNDTGQYIKLREELPGGGRKVCLMTLRLEAYT